MRRRYVSGQKVDVDEIRDRLYELLNDSRDRQNHHIQAWGVNHVEPCRVCAEHINNRFGIVRALRVFGSYPRYGWWK